MCYSSCVHFPVFCTVSTYNLYSLCFTRSSSALNPPELFGTLRDWPYKPHAHPEGSLRACKGPLDPYGPYGALEGHMRAFKCGPMRAKGPMRGSASCFKLGNRDTRERTLPSVSPPEIRKALQGPRMPHRTLQSSMGPRAQ